MTFRRSLGASRAAFVAASIVSPATAHAHGGVESILDASPFYAEHTFVPLGIGGQALTSRDRSYIDEGVEVSVHHFLPAEAGLGSLYGVGAYGQLQVGGVPLDGADAPLAHLRWAAGAQGTWSVLGAQVGVAHRAWVPGHADSVDACAGLFFSIGVISVGAHGELPVLRLGAGEPLAPAIGALFAVKFPWDLGAQEDERR